MSALLGKLLHQSIELNTDIYLNYCSWKSVGTLRNDAKGTPDNCEMINVAKDDILAYPEVKLMAYPSAVNERMESTIKPFTEKSIEVIDTHYGIFEEKLGLPAGSILKYHTNEALSGSEIRVIRSPPHPANELARDPEKLSFRAHTDVGSFSFLHNRLGGLQVLPPGSPHWQHVRPIPGHAICNIGDTLDIFSGGILHSNMHRIVSPPGAQAGEHQMIPIVD